MPHLHPVEPYAGADRAQRRVWEELRDQLPDEAALFHHLPLQLGSRTGVVDLLVAWPGVGLAVIGVEGGRVVRDAEGWWQGSPDTAHRIDPVRRVQDARHMLHRYLGQQRSPASRARCAPLLALPSMRVPATWEAPESPRAMVVDEDDLIGLGLRVRRAIENFGSGLEPLGAAGYESLVDVLAGALPSQHEHLAAAAEHDQRVEQLTPDQARLLEVLGRERRARVVGGAGTGKTWLALAQARRLARGGERVALLCASRGLARFLERVTQEWPGRERPAHVGVVHELPVRWGAEPARDDADREHRLPLRLLELAGARNRSALFDSVVLDEAQELGEPWWPALLACLRDGGPRGDGPEGGLFAFMDDAQRAGVPQGPVPLGLPPHALTENVRSTQRVAQLSSALVQEQTRPRGALGAPVRLVDAGAGEAVRAAGDAVTALLAEGWAPGQVAVLSTRQRAVGAEEGWEHPWDAVLDAEGVFHGHVLGFAGLERHVVVLAVDGFDDLGRARELLAAGFSRARSLLVVVGPRDLLAEVGGPAVAMRLHHTAPWDPRPTVA